ncbi:MAG: isoprenylcysteine carboxylmethyltransferase family protein [Streptosporangiales bacterium]|nr:isoprenylcysteine carboxylmethyltransferase family protein [Streptosporangiales bacterium]
MAVVSLVLYVCFILTIDVLRPWLQRRRTGDSGIRIRVRPVGSVQWWASLTMTAGGLLCVASSVAEIVGLPPLSVLDHLPLRFLGVAVAAVGTAVVLGCQLAIGDSWRIGVDETERTTLVTTGPFRVVRNPIFAAALVTIGGLTLTVPNAIAIVGLVHLVVGVELQVRRVEEPHLRHLHGRAYDEYAATVGRFVPGLGRTR